MHLWCGNYEGRTTATLALRDVIDVVSEARRAAISCAAANRRHEHEWAVFEDVELPEARWSSGRP